ncbi:MAG: hypothetical protein PWP15_757 [Methanothermococcus sp.]|jgi:hypothetical protein|uniref:hypothetical protein n=1 Tax=Methanothermococcus thermolithotrophicus TaxID=2186 RepID=UPI0006ACB512|nr:hypothetical protein [Methanothermococcus sp.]MDK2987643.1 hypothetical protein [Methanothermococcus sp.]
MVLNNATNNIDKEGILMEVGPYISNIEFLRNIIAESKDMDDLKHKLEELLKKETDITRKTDIRIMLEKIFYY